MKKRKLKKVKDIRNVLVPIISILIMIVSSFTFGIIKAIIICLVINLIYFIPLVIKKFKIKGPKKNTISEKKDVKIKKKSSSDKGIKKLKKENSKKRKKSKLKIFILIILICFILAVIGVIGLFAYIVVSAPEFDENVLYVSDPSLILDKDGNEIFKLGTEKRVTITYDQIPEVLIDAIVATEDSRFFEHNGVDWPRFIKASLYQLAGKSEAGGASTLTMQLSKNNYTSNEDRGIQGILRKFTDVYVSLFKIEKKYTKEQIMEFYVNSQYLGKNAYGVEQVSINYFGKSSKDLNVAEAAMIAGLFQAPGRYDPYKNPEATEARRQTVLKLMKRHGYITKEEYEIAKEMTVDKLIISKEKSGYSTGEVSPYQSFIDTVADEVQKKTGKNPYTTPMIVYTTLDTNVQDYVNSIMSGEAYEWADDEVKAGVAIIDVKNGALVAVGGSRDVNAIDQYNYATDITNQIGSTAKPLYDYGPAIEYNNWSPAHILVDEPITYSDGHEINNWDNSYQGFITMRTALNGSRNIPALKTFKANSKQKIIEFVTNLGLTPEIYSCNQGYTRDKNKCINTEDATDIVDANMATTLHEAHSIGGYNGESPYSMAAAYAAFSNGGVYHEPHTFTKIVYRDTNEEYQNELVERRAMTAETAYIISDMLATTAPQAMGGWYNINGIRYSAKTGTTNYDEQTLRNNGLWSNGNIVNDLWVVGFNTEYSIGIWYGYDSIKTVHHNTLGSGQHERLFQAIGKKVFTNSNYYTMPSGVVSVEIELESPTEMLPSQYTPAYLRSTELFIKGTEPGTVSQRFAKLSDVSNLKAEQKDNEVVITWDSAKVPDINTESYLRNMYSKVFENGGYLSGFIGSRLSYNQNTLGKMGYRVYEKKSDGTLQEVGFSDSNKYIYALGKQNSSGTMSFVVRTSYSEFKDNMSDGKTVNVNVKVVKDKPENDKPKTEDNEENDDTNNTNNENSNNDSNEDDKNNQE